MLRAAYPFNTVTSVACGCCPFRWLVPFHQPTRRPEHSSIQADVCLRVPSSRDVIVCQDGCVSVPSILWRHRFFGGPPPCPAQDCCGWTVLWAILTVCGHFLSPDRRLRRGCRELVPASECTSSCRRSSPSLCFLPCLPPRLCLFGPSL